MPYSCNAALERHRDVAMGTKYEIAAQVARDDGTDDAIAFASMANETSAILARLAARADLRRAGGRRWTPTEPAQRRGPQSTGT